jgi:predicted PurR-regulated permease PerM
MVIVGNLDSILRPLLIARGGGNMPLILVLFGIIGGAMAFGLIGLFLGPTFLAVGYSMFNEWSSDPAKLMLDGEGKSDLLIRTATARIPANTETSIKE